MIGFLDSETGGFSITKNGICEIAMIAVDTETLEIKDEIQFYIKPYTRGDDTDELVSYKDDSMAINGLTEQLLIDKGLDVVEACQMLLYFIVKNDIRIIIGHNSKVFDIPRVKYLFERFLGVDLLSLILQDDTMLIAKDRMSASSYKLSDLCSYFGIVNEHEHSALGDTYATYKLYQKLII